MSTNTTSTNDARELGSQGSSAGPASAQKVQVSSPFSGALPDPAVIARLANEFFAALPAVPQSQSSGGSTAGANEVDLYHSTFMPPAVPDFSREIGSAPAVPNSGVTSEPPEMIPPTTSRDPLTEADFRAIAASLTDATGLVTQVPVPALANPTGGPSTPKTETPSPWTDGPQFPPFLEMFSFPRVPAILSSPTSEIPGIAGPAAAGAPGLAGGETADPWAAAPNFPNELFSLPRVPGVSVPGVAQQLVPEQRTQENQILSIPPATHGVYQPIVSTASITEKGSQPTGSPPKGDEPFELRPDFAPAHLGIAKRPLDPHLIRRDFPILQERVHGRQLIWLDNAATTQKPNAVIDRLSYFYQHENSNIHRAAHTLAARATDAYEGAREKTRGFLNAASTREIIFVRGTTEGINLIAQAWGRRNVHKDDEVVVTWLEHHANIVPWQMLCSEKGARLRVAPVNDRGEIILDEYEKLLNPRTRIVSFSQVSNALGTITPAREMVEMAHRHGARVVVDGAQAVSHMRVDVQALDCDFYVFSGHKLFAPTGIGVVYGKLDLLETMPPWHGGGNMIVDVTFEKTVYQTAPARFEAGTGNIADAVGLGAAIDYVQQIGMESISAYEHELLTYATARLLTVPGLRLIGTAREKAGVLSFVLDDIRTEDVGAALNEEGIAVRSGHHCAQPILRRMGVESTVRPSLAFYNTSDEIDTLVATLHRLQAGRAR
jgi:cysteine desulfurase / selenocysteine lyase